MKAFCFGLTRVCDETVDWDVDISASLGFGKAIVEQAWCNHPWCYILQSDGMSSDVSSCLQWCHSNGVGENQTFVGVKGAGMGVICRPALRSCCPLYVTRRPSSRLPYLAKHRGTSKYVSMTRHRPGKQSWLHNQTRSAVTF